MRRLILLFAISMCATGVFAQTSDRDVVVTPQGTLYSVASVPANDRDIAASSVLEFTIQDGDARTKSFVPASLSYGTHSLPALAFDAGTNTLFVLWMHMPNMMSSELLLAAYHDGKWQPAVSIDNQAFHLRTNLKIAITRRVAQQQTDGSWTDVPALLLHLLYWEETGYGEEARYALIDIEKGQVDSIDIHPVADFIDDSAPADKVGEKFNRDILRHPGFIDNGSQNSVDIFAGDMKTMSFHRTTVKPIIQTRIRIPVGKKPGNRIQVPQNFSAPWGGRIAVIGSAHGSALVLAHTDADGVDYISYDGTWSSVKSIETGATISTESAIAALGRMVSAQ